ncbi:MFS transporter [Amycolatopsis orientalis]|uniref:MFS transporter n=1 Tax=Amycolatopsis orientalis TaxID=31958 RepID=UPI0003A095E0|nr:MFS transporter [Amycolatopsis orientalis]
MWTGQTVSTIGSAVAGASVPLVALLVLHASTFEVASLTAAAWTPWLVAGLPAGAWVDRWPKRRVMLVCDVLRLAAFGAVPVSWALGWLSFGVLLAAAVVGGFATVFFSLAYRAFLPSVVDDADLLGANVRLQGAESAAQVGGPGLAGLLASAFGPVSGVLVDAVSFGFSALCLGFLRADEPPPRPRTRLRAEIGEGMRIVARDAYLRVLVLSGGVANLALNGFYAVSVVFLVDGLGQGPGVVGLVLALGEAGGVLGATLVSRVARRTGTAWGFLWCEALVVPAMLLGPLAQPGWGLTLFVLAGAGIAAGVVGSNVLGATFRQRYCPRHLYGRISATASMVNYGTIPLGALLGGALGQAAGVRAAMFVMVGIQLASLGVLLLGPLRRTRDFPQGGLAVDNPAQGAGVVGGGG